MNHRYYTYILTNKYNKVLYAGVTGNLMQRIYQHRSKEIEGFSKRYNLTKVIFIQEFNDVNEALNAEKIIKGWKREKKVNLITKNNPNWEDLM